MALAPPTLRFNAALSSFGGAPSLGTIILCYLRQYISIDIVNKYTVVNIYIVYVDVSIAN